jgi:hypothetical protein
VAGAFKKETASRSAFNTAPTPNAFSVVVSYHECAGARANASAPQLLAAAMPTCQRWLLLLLQDVRGEGVLYVYSTLSLLPDV